MASCSARGETMLASCKRVDGRPRERAVRPAVERRVVAELGVLAPREQQRRVSQLRRRRRVDRAIDRALEHAVAARKHVRRKESRLQRRAVRLCGRGRVPHDRTRMAAVRDHVEPGARALGAENLVQIVVEQILLAS